jgi:hypothetical protein
MKQLSAVQATLERVQQIFLRNHLSTCVADAIQRGMGDEIIDELMEALKYNKSLTDGRAALAAQGAAGAATAPAAAAGEEPRSGCTGGRVAPAAAGEV